MNSNLVTRDTGQQRQRWDGKEASADQDCPGHQKFRRHREDPPSEFQSHETL